ncbi:MAG: trypsin-like peptidase domain-containing protein [Pirellulaceae bacterium]
MPSWISTARRWAAHAVVGCVLLGSSLATAAPMAAPETMPTSTATSASTAAASAASQHLSQILAGGSPSGVSDLRAMQDHFRKLSEQLLQCTVGVEVGAAQGSGVIISKDGYVLTAAHVAGQPKRDVVFKMADGRMFRGKTLGLNRTMDSGLMKIDGADDLPFAEIGVSTGLKEGQWCLATGHPGGYQSDRQPVLRLGRILLLQNLAITTDCTLVGGDSGGPLFDMQGKVIGINSRIANNLSANMHVPVGTFTDTWKRLTTAEAWGHYPGNEPYLGVAGDGDLPEAKITSVRPSSPAFKAGFQAGDIVLKLDDQDLTDFLSLTEAVAARQPGDKVKVLVQRGEETKELSVELGKKG